LFAGYSQSSSNAREEGKRRKEEGGDLEGFALFSNNALFSASSAPLRLCVRNLAIKLCASA